MKKIIATVLAMVMALALCTTAFAAEQKYDVYNAESTDGTVIAGMNDLTLKYNKADKDAKQIAYYNLLDASGNIVRALATETGNYVAVDKASDADYVVKYAGKNTVALYLVAADAVTYANGEGTAYTDLGKKCGQYDYKTAGYTTSDKFYTAISEADDEVYLFVKGYNTDATLLVDGKVIAVHTIGKLSDKVVQHTWVVDNAKMTAKCSACGATGKVYEKYAEVPSGADAELVAGMWVVADKTATKPADGTNSSPKTFDAGIAMYVGMALTSVAGSAVVIGKKKEF